MKSGGGNNDGRSDVGGADDFVGLSGLMKAAVIGLEICWVVSDLINAAAEVDMVVVEPWILLG
ncbi:hypothetical protein Dsin_009093 [Dipteronia sinensis]|uniref:Uncharacterized protein n=1 Tax=Dipteronia sinensis TaxID=43782 RepID=A0AAE0EBA7_9ROSI|nr:hypothetical protein Dsin_009093 [Dipteronia sinensis]